MVPSKRAKDFLQIIDVVVENALFEAVKDSGYGPGS